MNLDSGDYLIVVIVRDLVIMQTRFLFRIINLSTDLHGPDTPRISGYLDPKPISNYPDPAQHLFLDI